MNSNKMTKVGFIGLGLMGKPMAQNIHKAGFELSVYNRNNSKTVEFKKLGIPIYETPKALAQHADVVVSMVTGPDDVKEITLGKNGIVEGNHTGLIIIDMSTIGKTAAIEIGRELKKKSIDFIDAPVTGSTERAKIGELTIFAGGEEKVFKKIKPILLSMGKNIQYMGKSGSGQAVKLINNMIVAISNTALAEGMLLADILNLPREKVEKALENAPVMSPLLRIKMPNMVKNKYPTAFSTANMYKDLKLALAEAQKTNKKLPVLTLTEKLFEKGMSEGLADKDLSSILEVLSKEK